MIIKLKPGYVTQICQSVRDTFMQDHNKINDTLPDTFPGLGEFFYGQIMPMEAQAKVLELFPDYMKPNSVNRVCLQIEGPTGNGKHRWIPSVWVHISPALYFERTVTLNDLPGIKSLTSSRGGLLQIKLAEDTTALPAAIRDFVTVVANIEAAHRAVEDKIKVEVENMRRFLKDHKTIQSALAAMPALKLYLNWFILQELDAPEPEKKPVEKRKKVEKQPYDISGLVTKAATARLNL